MTSQSKYSRIGIAVGIAFLLLALCCYEGDKNKNKVESSPLYELAGEHGDFRLEVHGDDTVHVFVMKVYEPRARIKALSDALDLIEEESGKKVAEMGNGGLNDCVAVFYLKNRAGK